MWIKVKEFVKKYEISHNHLAVFKNSGDYNKLFKTVDGVYYIDESFFTRRIKFYSKIAEKAQLNYYFLSIFYSHTELAKDIERYSDGLVSADSMNNFLYRSELFSLTYLDRSILSYTIPIRLWVFYRITNYLINTMMRRCKIKQKYRRIRMMEVILERE